MQVSPRYRARLLLFGLAWSWPVVGVAQEPACPKDVAGFRIVCGVSLIGMRAVGGARPGSTMGSVERCAAACAARRDCVAFTMLNSSTGHCFDYQSDIEIKTNSIYISGLRRS